MQGPSVPIPKFANAGGTLSCELRNQRDTGKSMILVPLLNPKFAIGLPARLCELRVRGTSAAFARRLCAALARRLWVSYPSVTRLWPCWVGRGRAAPCGPSAPASRTNRENRVRGYREERMTGYSALLRRRLPTLATGAGAAVLGGMLVLSAGPVSAQQKAVKIGFISTFSGPTAVIGNDMRNSFELSLDHLGRTMAGLPVEVIYEDDQQTQEGGKQKTEKLIESDKVDFIVGYIWSNVFLASLKPAVDSKTFLISANAGPSQLAGELCSPYVFSTSWQNDQTPEAIGLYMNKKGVKSAYLIGPNYAAGKDMLAGVSATFKGQVLGQELTRWPDQLDFNAELSKARGAKP